MRRDSVAARRGITSGLTQVDPSTTDTLIAYAAKAGSTAEDGAGDHSPFASALLKDLTVPGRDIRIAFGYVKDDVMKSTSGRQEPFVYGSLGGGNFTLVPQPAQAQEPAVAEAKADFELSAVTESERAGWAKIVFWGNSSTNEQASVKLVNLKSGTVVWGYNVNKSSSARGKQSSSEACAKHLKEKIEKGS